MSATSTDLSYLLINSRKFRQIFERFGSILLKKNSNMYQFWLELAVLVGVAGSILNDGIIRLLVWWVGYAKKPQHI